MNPPLKTAEYISNGYRGTKRFYESIFERLSERNFDELTAMTVLCSALENISNLIFSCRADCSDATRSKILSTENRAFCTGKMLSISTCDAHDGNES